MAASTITRTNINVSDDSGSGQDGTVWDASWVTELQDQIDNFWDGTKNPLQIESATSSAFSVVNTGDAATILILNSNRASQNDSVAEIEGRWNGNTIGEIIFRAGPDTTNKDDGKMLIRTAAPGGSMATAITIDELQNVGVGATSFGTSAAGVLAIAIGTEPSSSPAGIIQLYAKDSSDGSTHATLAFRTEQAAEASASFTQSHRLQVWHNGTEYWLSLDAV